MPIPEFDSAGFLPAGVHECSLVEVKGRFGAFQTTDARCRLFERLETFLAEVRPTGFVVAVIVNGSFATSKHGPNDIDLILLLASTHDFSAHLRPFEYNVLSRRQVRKLYRFDILVAQEGKPELQEYVDFFAQVRGAPGRTKGMLRVNL